MSVLEAREACLPYDHKYLTWHIVCIDSVSLCDAVIAYVCVCVCVCVCVLAAHHLCMRCSCLWSADSSGGGHSSRCLLLFLLEHLEVKLHLLCQLFVGYQDLTNLITIILRGKMNNIIICKDKSSSCKKGTGNKQNLLQGQPIFFSCMHDTVLPEMY